MVSAFNGQTGDKLWEFETGGIVRSTPALGADGVLYVGSADNKVYALDTEDGNKLWEFVTGGPVNSSPTLSDDGVLYVGADDKNLYAIQASSGPADSSWPMFGQNAQNTGRLDQLEPTFTLIAGEGDNDNAAFTIDGNELKLNASADFESKDSYSIRILGKDASGLSIEKTMVLTVLNDLSEDGDNDGLIDAEEQLFGPILRKPTQTTMVSQTVKNLQPRLIRPMLKKFRWSRTLSKAYSPTRLTTRTTMDLLTEEQALAPTPPKPTVMAMV